MAQYYSIYSVRIMRQLDIVNWQYWIPVNIDVDLCASYTLECNYNTGRIINHIPMASGDLGRATPPPLAGTPPKYTPSHYEEVTYHERQPTYTAVNF